METVGYGRESTHKGDPECGAENMRWTVQLKPVKKAGRLRSWVMLLSSDVIMSNAWENGVSTHW